MLVLRTEKFGGIAFNDENAAQISLDKDGFFLFKEYIKEDYKRRLSLPKRKFIKNVLEILDIKDISEIKQNRNPLKVKIIKEVKTKNKRRHFEVLNSPTLADIQITTKCNLHCPHCYASSSLNGGNIAWEDLILALDSFSDAGVFQLALGGGEPTLHPKFIQILKAARERGITPNLTTNGKDLTSEIAEAMGRYCGAVALSAEGVEEDFERRRHFKWEKFCQSAKLLKKHGNKLVFQITASCGNIEKLPRIIDCLLGFESYGLILLAYKPVGRGKFFDDVLTVRENSLVKNIIKECLDKVENKTKIGFDCCFAKGIIELAKETFSFNFEVVEGCSALRNSLAVTKDLDVVPCSFINHAVGNLKQESLERIWNGEKSEKFRKKFCENIKSAMCENCLLKYQCLGGCPEFDLIKCSKG
ncbi:radical SAM protein [Patescibacteria group bacterium]|nr:radical SAM protein [Patescibacteria group bacterium]